jgi:hypothetical protein
MMRNNWARRQANIRWKAESRTAKGAKGQGKARLFHVLARSRSSPVARRVGGGATLLAQGVPLVRQALLLLLLLLLTPPLHTVFEACRGIAGRFVLLQGTLIHALAARAGLALETAEGVELFGRENAPDA